MIRIYAGKGYDFLAISDHDVASDYRRLDACGMTLLHGCEVSTGGPHILQVGGRGLPPPLPDRRQVVAAINSNGGLAILNHPNWGTDFNHYPFERLALDIPGAAGIEICNGTVCTSPGSHLATDKWDRLLTRGFRVFGFANDDAHEPGETGLAWNMVQARDRSPAAILDALRRGSFYASTGVRIETIEVKGSRVAIVAPDAQAIILVSSHGRHVHRTESPRLDFDAAGLNEPYLRAECMGAGGRMAWTQPLYIHGGEIDRQRRLTAKKPVLHVLRSKRSPRMNGRGDDPLWGKARAGTRFLRREDAQPSTVRTEMRCISAPGGLHFLFLCEEPAMDRLRTQVTTNATELWRDDSIELFIESRGAGRGYVQIMANAAGYAFGTRCNAETAPVKVSAKAARTGRGWAVEFAIPWPGLGGRPAGRTRWGFHACRNRKPVPETLMWAWVGESNHLPGNYGLLAF